MRRVGGLAVLALLVTAASAIGCAAADPEDGVTGHEPGAEAPVDGDTVRSVRYECEGGGILVATYSPSTDSPGSTARVAGYEGRTLRLVRAASGSGARYVGDGFEWWTRGRGVGAEATLARVAGGSGASGPARETLATCWESSALEPGGAPQT